MTTTEVVKDAACFRRRRLGEPRGVEIEDFDAWLADVRAKALEDYADEGERIMIGAGYEKPADDEWDIQPRWHEIRRLRERAQQIREGVHSA